MPPLTRRRAQQHEPHSPEPEDDDTESDIEISFTGQQSRLPQEEELGADLLDAEGEGDLEDGEALASPGPAQMPLPNLDPPPSYFREISTLASWRVSSSKPGCSIPQLRHPSTALFWQSDGPQPHYLNIHFFKLVRIVGLRLYLDFEQDESYTPTRIVFLAGSGMNDLQEWGEMKLENPRGWIWADFSGVGEPESDSEDEGDEVEIDLNEILQQAEATVAMARQEASSDFENNNPQQQQQQHGQHHPPFPPPADDQMQSNPQLQATPHAPQTHSNNMAATPTLHHPNHQATPSFPRFPSAALSPNPIMVKLPARRPRRPKLPVLCAHLVQIKIMENHQNGKDTHLRGLQIFARNDDKEGSREPVHRVEVSGMEGKARAGGELGMKKAKASRRAERLELGGFGGAEDSLR